MLGSVDGLLREGFAAERDEIGGETSGSGAGYMTSLVSWVQAVVGVMKIHLPGEVPSTVTSLFLLPAMGQVIWSPPAYTWGRPAFTSLFDRDITPVPWPEAAPTTMSCGMLYSLPGYARLPGMPSRVFWERAH